MTESIFPIIILNGRPAAGKSELLDYLRKLPDDVRRSRFHIGQMHEVDDFPMLWTWFEEDDLLQNRFDLPRLHSTPDSYFLSVEMWHLLIERLSLEYAKLVRNDPDLHQTHTILIEFSRGSEHGGYRDAYPHLSDTILDNGAILYIDVPFEESLRKNRRRFNPDKPDSILEHGLPDSKLERMYKAVDWAEVTAENPEMVDIRGHRVPYAVFHNHDDVTTTLGPVFEQRLEDTLGALWQRWTQHQSNQHK
ncbi:MAG: hypothetical protein H6672_01025 [Anaerolineaceae bacterium]|nr:hypothetical protein [Anaerolineaceae bacterium]